MYSQQSEMILVGQETDSFMLKHHDLRSLKQSIGGTIIKLWYAAVQIQPPRVCFVSVQYRPSSRVLRGAHHKIDIAIGSQGAMWIKAGRRPTFNQNRLDSFAAQ